MVGKGLVQVKELLHQQYAAYESITDTEKL